MKYVALLPEVKIVEIILEKKNLCVHLKKKGISNFSNNLIQIKTIGFILYLLKMNYS